MSRSPWGGLGNANTAFPMNSAFNGGSFANPESQSNSLMRMFAPGSEIQSPAVPMMNPFAGREHQRFEVPDTSRVVNLGQIVLFKTQSNNENFWIREILPLVHWGWAVRTFS